MAQRGRGRRSGRCTGRERRTLVRLEQEACKVQGRSGLASCCRQQKLLQKEKSKSEKERERKKEGGGVEAAVGRACARGKKKRKKKEREEERGGRPDWAQERKGRKKGRRVGR